MDIFFSEIAQKIDIADFSQKFSQKYGRCRFQNGLAAATVRV